MSEKLKYHTKNVGNKSYYRSCSYCGEELSGSIIVVQSMNEKIYEFFGMSKYAKTKDFPLCLECFEKFHSLLEDIESEGYSVIEESEFTEEELNLEGEDGTWTEKEWNDNSRHKKKEINND